MPDNNDILRTDGSGSTPESESQSQTFQPQDAYLTDKPDSPQETPNQSEPESLLSSDPGNPFKPEFEPNEPGDPFGPEFEPDSTSFKTSFELNQEEQAGVNLFDGDAAASAQKEWQARNDEAFNNLNARFAMTNKKLKLILFGALGAVAAALVAILILVLVSANNDKNTVEPPPPEPEIQIVKPDAIGVKKSDGTQTLADPGELNLALSTPVYEPESPGVMSYTADIPCVIQLYHGLGAISDLNKFQATASTYAALVRAELLEPLGLFHDIRYTDYQDQNHPEQEYFGTVYAVLSGTDYYQTHNYELLMDSDGCEYVTYSYTFNLKNTSRVEEYDFTDYIDCLRVLTGFDLTNNDILYLIRVSENNFNLNGHSSIQVISNADARDYILFEQSPASDAGNYNFVITCRKNLDNINAPDFKK